MFIASFLVFESKWSWDRRLSENNDLQDCERWAKISTLKTHIWAFLLAEWVSLKNKVNGVLFSPKHSDYFSEFVYYVPTGPVPIDSAEGEHELEALKVRYIVVNIT